MTRGTLASNGWSDREADDPVGTSPPRAGGGDGGESCVWVCGASGGAALRGLRVKGLSFSDIYTIRPTVGEFFPDPCSVTPRCVHLGGHAHF